jgi:hypothetical protein
MGTPKTSILMGFSIINHPHVSKAPLNHREKMDMQHHHDSEADAFEESTSVVS